MAKPLIVLSKNTCENLNFRRCQSRRRRREVGSTLILADLLCEPPSRFSHQVLFLQGSVTPWQRFDKHPGFGEVVSQMCVWAGCVCVLLYVICVFKSQIKSIFLLFSMCHKLLCRSVCKMFIYLHQCLHKFSLFQSGGVSVTDVKHHTVPLADIVVCLSFTTAFTTGLHLNSAYSFYGL